MNKEELIKKIKFIRDNGNDPETDHCNLDDLLLEYINNKEVTELFNSIRKWYS